MPDRIRRISKEEDFQKVSALFDYKKSVKLLKWLFKDPDNQDVFNAYVAENDKNQIVGIIGYESSIYKQGENEIKGVIFMSWKISTLSKGMTGVLLLKRVLEQGDFGFAYGGTKVAQNIYSIFKYKYIFNMDIYYKILDLKGINVLFRKSIIIKRLVKIGLSFPSYFTNPPKKLLYKDLELLQYDGNNFIEENSVDSVFSKKITKNYINWLLDCPTVESYAFIIRSGNDYLGICVLYMQKIKNNKIGRIVHLPFLGNDKKLWVSVIEKCIFFFRKKGCTVVSSLANHYMSEQGFLKSGFSKKSRDSKSFYIRDNNKKVSPINLNDWFFQFSEGDQAYRDF